ncbi:TonB-dependent receptor domain-containing protein [Aestuariivivens sp. NBU2969]|uniref:TonB-dependent receptor family protein n=1 Tax=Aestuariivivens sp. NBU2969 TaxID=2873267 RepID=UPI001CBE6B05|nr:TonB-dependent receptor [Aestuariivivens sp. NBU2969]
MIKGKIIESENGTALPDVIIINNDNQTKTFSLFDGTFQVLTEGTYLFKKDGYMSKPFKLKKNTFYVIQLNQNPSLLNEIIVQSNIIPKVLKTSTASLNLITTKDIQRSNNINFSHVLNRVPGIFMQSGALNTNRITIRGIGSRTDFGTSKIRAYFKDIPLTNGSGETTIEDFELASISSFEIVKGAVSSSYGAGLGGVIQLKPKNTLFNQTNINTEFSFGSFGLSKQVINLNFGSTKNSVNAIYSNTDSNGYRDNNNYTRQTFTFNTNHFLNAKNKLSFLTSYVDLKAYIPSSLNEDDFMNNPKKAAFTWGQAQGYEDSERAILGLSWQHDFNTKLIQHTSLFTSYRKAYEPRPFNILDESTWGIGLRTRLLGNTKWLNKKLKWTIGIELFKDLYKYKTIENLYKDFPIGTGSVKGNILTNFKEDRSYYNIFTESYLEVSKNTTLSLGLNLNKTAYKLDDKFPVSQVNPDQSGSYKYRNIVSPKLGVNHLAFKDISIFSSISHGFSPLSANETLLPNGQINNQLKPETGWNFEIGSRGMALKNKLRFQLSIYRLAIKNLLVSRRTDFDEFIGINAGKTRHNGLELDLNYNWLQTKTLKMTSFISYSLNNYKFKVFIDDNNDFSGNDLTGVPSNVLNAGLDINFNLGLYGHITHQHVGSMPITDSNSLYSNSYNLTHLKMGYLLSINKSLKVNVFMGINNIFDTHYASQILINATGFNGSAPRYYYPGNPTNYFTGCILNYIF